MSHRHNRETEVAKDKETSPIARDIARLQNRLRGAELARVGPQLGETCRRLDTGARQSRDATKEQNGREKYGEPAASQRRHPGQGNGRKNTESVKQLTGYDSLPSA